jgi:hypothetical protein
MCSVQGPSVFRIELLCACRPALREGPNALVGARVPGLGGDASRDTDALLDDSTIAELGEAVGNAEHTFERGFGARAQEGGQIRLTGFCLRVLPETPTLADDSIRVADRHHAFPVAALEGRGVRVAPRELRARQVAPRQGTPSSDAVVQGSLIAPRLPGITGTQSRYHQEMLTKSEF